MCWQHPFHIFDNNNSPPFTCWHGRRNKALDAKNRINIMTTNLMICMWRETNYKEIMSNGVINVLTFDWLRLYLVSVSMSVWMFEQQWPMLINSKWNIQIATRFFVASNLRKHDKTNKSSTTAVTEKKTTHKPKLVPTNNNFFLYYKPHARKFIMEVNIIFPWKCIIHSQHQNRTNTNWIRWK